MLRTVVVDDSEDVRTLWCAALEHSGAFVMAGMACDGPTAVEMVRREQPDLVLLDLSMPGMNGLQALPLLQAAAPRAQIVVVSSASRREYATQVVELGAIGFLEKHAPVQTLPQRLLQMLETPAVRPSAPSAEPLILVVEPEADTREQVAYLLGWMPYRTRIVEGAVEGLSALHTDDPDVLMLDLRPWGARGPEAIDGLLRAAAARNMPVIALSHARTCDGSCRPDGIAGCLHGPIGPEALRSALESLGTRTATENAGPEQSVRDAVAALVEDLGPDAARAVWGSFERSTRRRCLDLERALADANPGAVAGVAHALKGSAAAIGVSSLSAISAGIESEASAGRSVDPSVLVDLAGAFDAARAAAASLFDGYGAAVPNPRNDLVLDGGW